jgi:multimeric flavodoxin WrbA
MSEKEPTIFVAGICGSLRTGSYTRRAVECALLGAAEAGAQTQLIDLSEYQLVFRKSKDDVARE